MLPPHNPFTQLSVSTGDVRPIAPGASADLTAMVRERSTGGGSASVDATVPTGWKATATPARLPLTPATSHLRSTLRITVPEDTATGVYPVTVNVRAPDGTRAATTLSVPVFGAFPAGTTAAASSEHAPNIVDGATRTYAAANAIDGNPATFWNDNTQGEYPTHSPSPLRPRSRWRVSASSRSPTACRATSPCRPGTARSGWRRRPWPTAPAPTGGSRSPPP
ncbi:NEW3 domain-containing protein [Streptomyces sp. M10(2022)]